MDAQSASTDLTGKLLIAMPGMGDPRFAHSVVYLCAHSDEGAMGLIVNKPSGDVSMTMLLDQLSIEPSADMSGQQVHFGGPVEMGRGFVLHSPDYESVMTTLEVDPDIHMTATLDVLEDIARGQGPRERLMMLGYAGWGAGQLEAELAENGWLVCDASPDLVFRTSDDGKWQAALATLGVSALTLSSEGGRA
ncbi:YqgE/AlgH family protein [Thalassococcus sp. BH17M4-6]|uniref:YqgE/AlgH family protein n=1 Tax=Thalassococcus sp. BH17M4-6 TaxID=3413148 RepID=UPI003BC93ED3